MASDGNNRLTRTVNDSRFGKLDEFTIVETSRKTPRPTEKESLPLTGSLPDKQPHRTTAREH
jgi:hypothetical protein